MYRAAVLVHLLGVLLFFGNLSVAFALMLGARRQSDPSVIGHSYRLLHRVDLWLTPVSVALIFAGGVAAARVAGITLLQPWVTRPLLLFGLSGAAFLLLVLPAQRKLVREGATLLAGPNPEAYHRLRRRWLVSASVSTAMALLAVALMVLTSPR
ncbi:MAG: hypothetical protein AMXMBFR53_35520 [Gemmatimonadota bacterium]